MTRRGRALLAFVVLLAVAAGALLLRRGRPATEGVDLVEDDEPAFPTSEPPLAAGGPSARGADVSPSERGRGLESESGELELVGRLTVRVASAKDGSPVPRAQIEVSFPLSPPSGGAKGAGPELFRQAATGDDGVAEIERMPVGRAVRVAIRREWFLPAAVDVPASDDESQHVRVSLEPALSRAESEATVHVDVDSPAVGVDAADVRVSIVGEHVAGPDLLRPGEAVYIENRPDGAPTRDVRAQILMPGYAGPMLPLTIERGKATRIAFRPPPPVALTFTVATPDAAPIADAVVELLPLNAPSNHRAAVAVRAKTDARGSATLSTRVGEAIAVRAIHPWTYFPPDRWGFAAPESARAYQLVVLRLAALTIELEGDAELPERGVASLRWGEVRLDPDVERDLRLHAHPTRAQSPLVGYRDRLPAAARWATAKDGVRRLRVGLLPGSYSLEVGTARSSSSAESFALPAAGARVRAGLRTPSSSAFRLTTRAGAREPGPLVGALVVGHAASFDERFAIEQALGVAWPAPLALARLDDEGRALVLRLAARALGRLSGRDPRVPRDVGVVDAAGDVSLSSHAPPAALTVMANGGGVARVEPAPTRADGAADVVVPAASLRSVRVRVRDAGGAPQPALRLGLNPLRYVEERRLDLSVERTTDADGVALVGALPGDEFALHVTGEFELEGSGGATAERRATAGGERQFVVVRWALGDDPVVELRGRK